MRAASSCATLPVVSGERGVGSAEKALAMAMVCALAFATLAGQAAQQATWGVDREVRDLVHQSQHPIVVAGMHAVSTLGTPLGLLPLIALASCLGWRRSPQHALL